MARKIEVASLLLLTLISIWVILTSEPELEGSGEVLWRGSEGTLYRCGPQLEDICFDDGVGVRKVYYGEGE